MDRQKLLDLYFMEARAKLIDLAAFLDRMERGEGTADFRLEALQNALPELTRNPGGAQRAQRVLMALSDPTTEPAAAASTQGACGAYPGAHAA